MSFRPEEVSAILAQELERYEAKIETKSVGTVLSVGDGIARLWGLDDAMAGELLKFPGDVVGMVLNLEEDNVGAVLFGSDKNIKEGDRVERTGHIASVPVGKAMIGRVVSAIGKPVDGKGPIGADHFRNLRGEEIEEHGVEVRQGSGEGVVDFGGGEVGGAVVGVGSGEHEFLGVQPLAAIDGLEHLGVQAGGDGEQLRGDERQTMTAAIVEVERTRVEPGPVTTGDPSGGTVATHRDAGRRSDFA